MKTLFAFFNLVFEEMRLRYVSFSAHFFCSELVNPLPIFFKFSICTEIIRMIKKSDD